MASSLQEMDLLRPSRGRGVINQTQFSSSSSIHVTDGKVHVLHSRDCFSIFNCLMLFNSKKTQTHFLVGVGEHCLLMKEEDTKT